MFPYRCSFCGKSEEEVSEIIAAHGVTICNECVVVCTKILDSKKDIKHAAREEQPLPTPEELKEHLDQYVIGQYEAKKTLAVGVYNHYKRIMQKTDDVDIEKSNILLAGPTGCGKTLLVKTLAKKLDVPFAICNATSFTEAGYVGEDVESVLLRLLQDANGDLELCEKGIVYIDEIDKIAKKDGASSSGRDVSGEGVQQALLQLMEGTVTDVPPKGSKRAMHHDSVAVDTTNILFIVGGAFSGLEELVKEKTKNKTIGFGSIDIASKEGVLEAEDFISFGLIPEFLGRLPIVTMLSELSKEDLIKILSNPKNSLTKQFTKLFAIDGVKLEFTKGAIEAIAEKGLSRGVGARGLRAIVENTLKDTMFIIPKSKTIKCKITKTTINGGKAELYETT